VGAVITMVAVGAGAQARVAEQIQSLGANVIVIWPSTVNMAGVRLGAGAQATLSEDDAWAIQRDVPLVEVVAPYSRGTAQVVFSNLNWSTGILGVTPEYFPARDWEVISGRTVTQEEVDGASKIAVIGQTVARNLFGEEDPIGQVIRIKKVPFIVVGLLDRKGQTTWGQDQDDQILIPLTTAKTKVLGGNLARAERWAPSPSRCARPS
jgi:putative ABC transport system permease protein